MFAPVTSEALNSVHYERRLIHRLVARTQRGLNKCLIDNGRDTFVIGPSIDAIALARRAGIDKTIAGEAGGKT